MDSNSCSGTTHGRARSSTLARSATKLVAVAMLVLAALTWSPPAARAEGPGLPVWVFDGFGVDFVDRLEAGATARDILSRAGIDVSWHECGQGAPALAPCEGAMVPGGLVVRIIRAEPHGPRDRLGYALLDAEGKNGRLATVFGDAIGSLADRAGVALGPLLGGVMAHEIGHLILGARSHSRRGLMRADWKVREVRQAYPADWLMSAEDARRLQEALVARSARMQTAPSQPADSTAPAKR